MGRTKKPTNQSRRDFFSHFLGTDNKKTCSDKIKLLTADGRLVEVDKDVVSKVKNRQKADNKIIFEWMNNPSKNDKT